MAICKAAKYLLNADTGSGKLKSKIAEMAHFRELTRVRIISHSQLPHYQLNLDKQNVGRREKKVLNSNESVMRF